MKKIFFLPIAATLLTVTLISCEKETASKNSPGIFPGKVRSVNFTGTEGTGLYQNPNTTEYYYKPDGSFDKIVFLDSALKLIGTEDYQYGFDKVTAVQVDKHSGAVIAYTEYHLSADNIVDSVTQGRSSSEFNFFSKLVYDAAGRVIEEKVRFADFSNPAQPVDTGHYRYTYANGNLVQFESSFEPYIYTFEYSGHNNNASRNPFGFGLKFDRSEKLVARAFIHTAANPQPVLTFTVAYTFDSSNRIATETTQSYHANGVDPGGSITRTFTYW